MRAQCFLLLSKVLNITTHMFRLNS